MHELSLTQGIIDICQQHAGGRKVLSLTVEIGTLSGVVPEAVEFCFEACSSGTLLEGARLNIRRIEGLGRCQECTAEFPLATLFDPCPGCGGHLVSVAAGEEMRVREIDVED